jgi:hypothetical protein
MNLLSTWTRKLTFGIEILTILGIKELLTILGTTIAGVLPKNLFTLGDDILDELLFGFKIHVGGYVD